MTLCLAEKGRKIGFQGRMIAKCRPYGGGIKAKVLFRRNLRLLQIGKTLKDDPGESNLGRLQGFSFIYEKQGEAGSLGTSKESSPHRAFFGV